MWIDHLPLQSVSPQSPLTMCSTQRPRRNRWAPLAAASRKCRDRQADECHEERWWTIWPHFYFQTLPVCRSFLHRCQSVTWWTSCRWCRWDRETVAVSQVRGCILCGLHLLADYVTFSVTRLFQFEGSFKGGWKMEPSFPEFEGYTRWILYRPVYPKMQCGLAFCPYKAMKWQWVGQAAITS